MSLEVWKVEEMEMLSSELLIAGRKIAEVCAEMRKKNYLSLVLQARAAQTTYRPAISRLAAGIENEFRDQYNCSITGAIPSWQMNQKKVDARRERDAKKKKDKTTRRKEIKPAAPVEKELAKRPSRK